MYIYRIVIDANCINARNSIPEMSSLEKYHDAGLIEILQTSTLPVELKKGPLLQANKAKKYGLIGGCCSDVGIPGEKGSQTITGAGVRESQMEDLMNGIFGSNLKGNTLKRALRDVLHIDQAHQNDADYFVTNDKHLIESNLLLKKLGIELEVLYPSECLLKIRTSFEKNFGTSEIEQLCEKFHKQGPLILGSNSSYGLNICDSLYNETLIDLNIDKGYLLITAKLRSVQGRLLIELSPNMKPIIYDSEISLITFGKGPLRCSEESCYQFTVWHNSIPLLAARATHNYPRRIIFNRMLLRNKDGCIAVHINKEVLEIHAAYLKSK